jgi:hypothetical protein
MFQIALLLQVGAAATAADDVCNRIFGNWNWFIGGTVTYPEGARARWTLAISTMPATAEGRRPGAAPRQYRGEVASLQRTPLHT